MREATVQDVLRILRERSVEVRRLLVVSPIEFSLPTDGMGVRIKVSTLPELTAKVPTHLECELDGEYVDVRVEVSDDYEEVLPQ